MNVINPVAMQAPSKASDSTTSGGAGLPTPQGLNNMFLQLLVAQLQHQSPLNPMDPTQFVGQLAQFSELSEVTQIEQMLQQALSKVPGKAEPSAGGNVRAAHANDAPVAVPEAMVSSAVAAARAAIPAVTAPVTSILNSKIQGVF